MNILIFGYGKMGKTIEKIARDRGHSIVLVIDKDDYQAIGKIDNLTIDVAIEFTQPEAAVSNLLLCFDKGIPVISGTTGWLDKLKTVQNACHEKKGTFFYASNFSLGVNIFFRLNQYLAKIMSEYPEYGVTMEEIHHTEKKDAPSGTAITLAEDIIKINAGLQRWVNQENSGKDEIEIISKRMAEVPGTHTINYQSAVDNIEIKHVANSRQGFALGAVLVAEWIQGKTGVLTMEDFLKI